MNFENLDLTVETANRKAWRVIARADNYSETRAPVSLKRGEQMSVPIPLTNADAERAGRFLFGLLFPPPVLNLYQAKRAHAQQQKNILRLRLILDTAPNQLPWEYLFDPQSGNFLARDPYISLVRYPALGQELGSLDISPPLKILVVSAQPRDEPPLNLDVERQSITSGLQELVANKSVTLDWLDQPTPDSLRQAIAQRQVHVLHFLGHGRLHAQLNQSGVILVREDGYGTFYSSSELATLTASRDPLRVVVLNACESGVNQGGQPYSSVAGHLLLQGQVAAVIAMQTRISSDASIAFTREFYQTLAREGTLDEAVTEGRRAIFTRTQTPEWATPALYWHASDDALIRHVDDSDLPRLEAIPDAPHLFGREQEIETFRTQLESTNRVIIEGMAGIGKTTLGAVLAREQLAEGRRVFWMSFNGANKSNGEIFVWDLAGFLARHGKPQLWEHLQLETESSERNAVRRFTLLINSLQDGKFTLCFDDLQLVQTDPVISQLFESLRRQYKDHPERLPARFIVMTRQVPSYMQYLSSAPLKGLTLVEMCAWLDAEGIHLSAPLSKRLYDKVQGNPHFARLAMTGLARDVQDSAALERRIDDLEIQSNVHDYLMTQVYELLDKEDKRLLDALCVFDAFVPSEALKQISVGENVNNVARRLRELARRNVISEKQETQEFGLHALVRDWCYENLDVDVRQRLNEKAGGYFERQREFVAAAHHLAQAAQYERAATLLTENADELMNRGNLEAIVSMMPELLTKVLPQTLYLKSVYAMALALAAMGKDKQAAPLLEEVVALSENELQIQALTSLGESLRVLGEFARANEILRRATQMLDQDKYPELSVRAFEGLGWTEYRLGNLDAAELTLQKALDLAERSKQRMLAAHARLRLGQVLQERGQFERAYELELASLSEFEKAGQVRYQADANLALGYSSSARGAYAEAEGFYRQAIQTLEMLEDDYGIIMGLNDLGDVLRAEQKYDEAIPLLERAAALAESGNYKYMMVVVGLSLADLYLDQNALAEARAQAENAITRAQEWNYAGLEALGARTLGNVYAALMERERALANYQRAALLVERVGSASEQLTAYKTLGAYLGDEGCDYLHKALRIAEAIQARQEQTALASLISERCSDH